MSSTNTFSSFQSLYGQLIQTSGSSLGGLSNQSSSTSNSPHSSSSSLNSNLDKLMRGELNGVSMCGVGGRRDSIVNVGKFLNQRSYGNRTPHLNPDYGLHHLISNNLLKENQIDLGQEVDKIYSSCWLNDDDVICGTKCNKLILINLNNKKHYYPSMVSSRKTITDCNKSGGLYSISINPSRTLMATGTTNSNDIVIYSLPQLDILFLLEDGHNDFIFDIVWLDDQFLMSGSRDAHMCLWRVDPSVCEFDHGSCLYKMNYLTPIKRFIYFDMEKIRCLNFNSRKNELGVLSINAKLHLIDALTMNRKLSTDLPQKDDLVCLTQNEDNLYAVGSKSHVQLIDSRTLKPVSTITSKEPHCGIRSLSFNSKILTVGTGVGNVFFYDIKNSKYFNNQINQDLIVLKTSKGWIQRLPLDQQQNYGHFSQFDTPAIYTHQYDKMKTRLFAAGGPLASNFRGNYCGVWGL